MFFIFYAIFRGEMMTFAWSFIIRRLVSLPLKHSHCHVREPDLSLPDLLPHETLHCTHYSHPAGYYAFLDPSQIGSTELLHNTHVALITDCWTLVSAAQCWTSLLPGCASLAPRSLMRCCEQISGAGSWNIYGLKWQPMFPSEDKERCSHGRLDRMSRHF